MHVDEAHRIADAATVLHGLRPKAKALEVLDQVFGGRRGEVLIFSTDLLSPPSPFGQLIAEAFDPCMSPAEWADWAGEGADLLLRDALLGAWSAEVLPRFTSRYALPPVQ